MKPARHDIEFIEAFYDPQKRLAKLKRLYFNRLASRVGVYLMLFTLITGFGTRFVFENKEIWTQVMLAALLSMLFSISLYADFQIKVLLTLTDRKYQKS